MGQRIMTAFKENPQLPNLLMDPSVIKELNSDQDSLRRITATAITQGIPAGAFCGSLAYIDSLRTARLPACLTQAQRDFFGAHTYERMDKKEGEWFHTQWTDEHKTSATSGSYVA